MHFPEIYFIKSDSSFKFGAFVQEEMNNAIDAANTIQNNFRMHRAKKTLKIAKQDKIFRDIMTENKDKNKAYYD